MSSRAVEGRLSPAAKAVLALRIGTTFALVRLRLRNEPLPQLVARLAQPGRLKQPHPTTRLSNAVYRTLRLGSRRPTCLVNALVLFRLLREQGEAAELVIGLPRQASGPDAHAWVEVDGIDVGPPPGQSGNEAMMRLS